MTISNVMRTQVPGLALLSIGALIAYLISGAVDSLQPLVVSVILGFVIGNLFGIPDIAGPGVNSHKLFLETGIVLLGAAVAIGELISAGPTVLGLIVLTVGGGVLLLEGLARGLFRIDNEMSSLLAAGASICGVSAVVAIGRVLDARGATLTFAAATILIFDAITLVVFPIAGEWLNLSARQFGVWAGVSMFSTGPVAAAGFSHSPEAGQWATVTKLARNSLLGGVAVAYSVVYTTKSRGNVGVSKLWKEFPKFLLGFVLVAVIANSGLLSTTAISLLNQISDVLFALAFVGLGLSIRVREMRRVGSAPIIVVLLHLLVVSVLTLLIIQITL